MIACLSYRHHSRRNIKGATPDSTSKDQKKRSTCGATTRHGHTSRVPAHSQNAGEESNIITRQRSNSAKYNSRSLFGPVSHSSRLARIARGRTGKYFKKKSKRNTQQGTLHTNGEELARLEKRSYGHEETRQQEPQTPRTNLACITRESHTVALEPRLRWLLSASNCMHVAADPALPRYTERANDRLATSTTACLRVL